MKDKIVSLGISSVEAEELLKVSTNINSDYNKLLNKYPIQYLIGYVNFYGYKIYVNDNVLIPRYETEYLVEKTIKYINKIYKKTNNLKILDLCTGSGCIAISLSKELNIDIDASDISKDAINIAKKSNNENNANVNFIKSDLFKDISNKYDVIISNPPYISYSEEIMESVKKYEPNIALYADNNGLFFYEEILKNVRKHLNNKFLIAFEIGYLQADKIKNIIEQNLEDVKIIIEQDLSKKDRYIFIIHE